jgi:hypothetical protein
MAGNARRHCPDMSPLSGAHPSLRRFGREIILRNRHLNGNRCFTLSRTTYEAISAMVIGSIIGRFETSQKTYDLRC